MFFFLTGTKVIHLLTKNKCGANFLAFRLVITFLLSIFAREFADSTSSMKYITLPKGTGEKQVPFFLATEEWAARYVTDEADLFMMWQVGPSAVTETVIQKSTVTRRLCG